MSDWIESLERDIEVTEGQLAIALLLPKTTTRFVNVEAERLQRLVDAAKTALKKAESNRDEPCPRGGKHSWIGDEAGDSWCEKCSEALFE